MFKHFEQSTARDVREQRGSRWKDGDRKRREGGREGRGGGIHDYKSTTWRGVTLFTSSTTRTLPV